LFTQTRQRRLPLYLAAEVADHLGATIRILVPQIVPYPCLLEFLPVDPVFRIKDLITTAVGGSVDTYIDVRLCRDAYQGITQSLSPESIILIGGRKRWWLTREQRLLNVWSATITALSSCRLGRL
jgi:hypothetical protein